MDTLSSIDAVRGWRGASEVGFVPTMGALHEGHASLIRRSVTDNPRTLVSIFVNPAQFAPGEDLAKYPRTIQQDLQLCADCGADAVFTPDKQMMYPPGFATWVDVEGLTDRLCGATRPGHFRGVTTVVAKLFHITGATRAYFGQKDAQQVIVLRRMVDDLNLPIELITCPIIREPDGLAMSSRNRYLSALERERATGISKALRAVETLFQKGTREVSILRASLVTGLSNHVDKLDYAEVLDAGNLSDIQRVDRPSLAAVAAFIGSTRLIDNVVLAP
ncbi:MAG: pantoate--beta-alanine ligase [Planctomycetes bacterium]|nr:pantoate--beta-alanine ligase [Planctomycetota bacterium]